MIQHGKIGANKAVKAYDVLLTDLEIFLTDHVAKKMALRFVNHWKAKDKIKLFYAKRDQIVDLMRLEFLEETAFRHASVTNRLDEILDREQHIEEQCKKEFESMKDTVQLELKALDSELAHRAGNTADGFAEKMVVALSDIKYELKYNKTRTDEERRELKQVFDLAKRATQLETPHLSAWYISGADIQYESTSLAAGQSGSMHIGKLSFGAKVLVKVSNAAADDTENRKRFTDEVEKWYPLRHPHVLPLYGASEFTTPQLFVLAYAEKGNFSQFLPKHPHLFWKVFLDAARGLVYLHHRKTPLVHGNLKCSNLLAVADGTGVVSDFAFAFLRADSNLSGKVQSPSTGWKAPECLRIGSGGNARVQSDVYSLGMCVYEGLMGWAPFDGLDEDEIIANIRRVNYRSERVPGSTTKPGVSSPRCAHSTFTIASRCRKSFD